MVKNSFGPPVTSLNKGSKNEAFAPQFVDHDTSRNFEGSRVISSENYKPFVNLSINA